MTKNGGQRIASPEGAMLADPASLGNLAVTDIFEPEFWAERGELTPAARGRGGAWFIGAAPRAWVLRHCRRGGLIARLSADRYVWAGESRVRAFAEWRLLEALARRGLPVPKPIAARYRRTGLFYRCDLITQRILGAEPLSTLLARAPLAPGTWREVGVTVARLHAVGVDHADLNAHNILIGEGNVSLIDFDRGRLRQPGAWSRRNVARLHRSLLKVTRGMPEARFSPALWTAFLAGYASVPGAPA